MAHAKRHYHDPVEDSIDGALVFLSVLSIFAGCALALVTAVGVVGSGVYGLYRLALLIGIFT